jgi:hypothetical protein
MNTSTKRKSKGTRKQEIHRREIKGISAVMVKENNNLTTTIDQVQKIISSQ